MSKDREVADLSRFYQRELPGGGVVTIELGVYADLAGDRCHGRVSVERRDADDRRAGHEAPVIAQLDGATQADVFGELYRIAADNAAVARGLLRWRRGQGPAPIPY